MSRASKEVTLIPFHVVRGSLGLLLRVWNRMTLRGARNIPRTGACILAANHASYLDPPAVAAGAMSRVVRFMARDTLASDRFWSWLMPRMATVLISREKGDLGAMRAALQVLKEGGCLALFPEGTRTHDGQLGQAKGGIGFLIAKAAVPVVPVYVDGTFKAYPRGAKWIRPSKVRVYFGTPIQPQELLAFGADRDGYERIGRMVMERIAALKPAP